MLKTYRNLLTASLLLTLCVVVLGAYVRLADAGLGCPDWPGCYGQITPLHAADDILAAHANEPHGPVSMAKAWKEMTHRYLASVLGLCILVIAVLSWQLRRHDGTAPRVASALFIVVCCQGMLGMLTVTEQLKPAIVLAHLLGGLTTLALTGWLWLLARDHGIDSRQGSVRPDWQVDGATRTLVLIGVLTLLLQISLGGWTSANYAATICDGFPSCQGSLWPDANYREGFSLARELGRTPDGDWLSANALIAIHWTHRLGALLTVLVLGSLAWRLGRYPAARLAATALAATLSAQLLVGIANVVMARPLALAVMHNALAAALVLIMVWLVTRTGTRSQRFVPPLMARIA